jgi:hypothetical protein
MGSGSFFNAEGTLTPLLERANQVTEVIEFSRAPWARALDDIEKPICNNVAGAMAGSDWQKGKKRDGGN